MLGSIEKQAHTEHFDAMTEPLSRTAAPSNYWRRPRLRTDTEGESQNHASWIELFFDLVFVVAISELSHTLASHLTGAGFWQFVALFVPCWWAWVLVTFYVDRYDTDDPPHRVLILSAMLAAIFLSANIHSAFEGGAIGFVLAYAAIRSIVLILYYRASHYVSAARANVRLYLASYLPSTFLWLASLAVDAPIRYGLWGIAVAIELLVPILGSRILAGTPAHPSHLQERYGLFTLIVLGEAIVSVATTVNKSWQPLPIFVAVCGFGVAACLWWLYFNFLETATIVRGIGSVHVFNYGHLPIVMGLVLVAVGTERTIVETATASVLSIEARWALLGGVALYMSAITLMTVFACRRRFSWLMVVSIAAVLGLAIFGGSLSPPLVIGMLLVLLAAKVSHQIFTTRSQPQLDAIEPIEFGN